MKSIYERYDTNENGCFIWNGPIRGKGYGYVKRNKKLIYVHRLSLAYKLKINVNELKLVRHLCDNKLCFNPDHLVEGTHKQNSMDRESKYFSNTDFWNLLKLTLVL